MTNRAMKATAVTIEPMRVICYDYVQGDELERREFYSAEAA
jgi:hypothetical protein